MSDAKADETPRMRSRPLTVKPDGAGGGTPKVTLTLSGWITLATFILGAAAAIYTAGQALFVTRPEFHRLDKKVTVIGERMGAGEKMREIDEGKH